MTDPAIGADAAADAGFVQRAALDRRDLAPAERTLIDVLRETVRRHPDASAIEDATGALSYREFAARIEGGRRLASATRACAAAIASASG